MNIPCHRQYDGLIGDYRNRPSRIKERFYGRTTKNTR